MHEEEGEGDNVAQLANGSALMLFALGILIGAQAFLVAHSGSDLERA